MTIGERIKERREELGLSVEELAAKLNKNRATVYRYENGYIEDVPTSVLESIANVLKTTPAELMGYDYSNAVKELVGTATIDRYPMLGDAACGTPIIANPAYEVYSDGHRIKADALVRAKGDSMIGARIYDGDIVFIRYQEAVENGDIVAVLIEDEVTHDWEIVLKKFKKYDANLIVLHSENPAYEDIVIKGEKINRIRIIGKAVAFQSEFI